MRQTIFAVGLMSAVGIRRWASGDLAMEDLTRVLMNEGHHKLGATMQSLVQSGSLAGWLGDSSAISSALESLSDNIVETLKSENTNQQGRITGAMNEFARAIAVRKELESSTQQDETVLSSSVSNEKEKSGTYDTQLDELKISMSATYAPCALQDQLIDYEFTLAPQTSFSCDFSAQPSDVENNCEAQYQKAVQNASTNVQNLNTSLTAHGERYAAAEADCLANISFANEKMEALISSYDSFSDQREDVSSQHINRRNGVCSKTIKCEQTDSKTWEGLTGAYDNECLARQGIDTMYTNANTRNNSDSLEDRNYEYETVQIIACLLEKLKDFGDGEWEGANVSAIIDQCQKDAATSGLRFELNFITTETTDSSSCVPTSVPDITYKELSENTKCDFATGSSVQLASSDGDEGGSQFVELEIPEALALSVERYPSFAGTSDDGTDVECKWWCASTSDESCVNGLRTLDCKGNSQVSDQKNSFLLEVGKVSVTRPTVPIESAYVDGTSTYSVSISGVSASVSTC